MKKNIKNILLVSLLAVTPVVAESTIFGKNTQSLFGIEAAYGGLNVNGVNKDGTSSFDEKSNLASIGIKLGAESENYRVFLSARYNKVDDFDTSYMVGVELQYLLNFSQSTNFFIGVNAGMADMKYVDNQNFVRTISDPYMGGDVGVNYHLNPKMDLEFGVRLMSLDAYNLKNNIEYKFDTMVTAYTGLIYKF